MPEQHLFEYAIIRVVPQVEREEFMNVGVVVFCMRPKFLQARYLLNQERLAAFGPKLDIAEIEAYLCAFERICNGQKGSGKIGELPHSERFRWLTATRSTVVQCSKVHPGLCESPPAILERLYEQMVL